MICIDNMRLEIGGNEILKGINLHLKPGDIYGLLGPNGAGKSSTIFALLGLRQYSSGSIKVLGYDPVSDSTAIRRSVGVLPEKAGFYEWMSAKAYLKWYSQLYRQTSLDRDIEVLLEKVGLGNNVHRPIATYSRGMKQRLAIARALVASPQLLLLDEPTNGLDPKGRREIHDLLLEYADERNTGIMICTHLLDDVDRLCNRIAIIDMGRTQLEGNLAELLSQERSGHRYLLRLEAEPNLDDLPTGLSLQNHQGDWWLLQIRSASSEPAKNPADLWGELWQRGWRILEIRSEASSLEQLYLEITEHHPVNDKEGSI